MRDISSCSELLPDLFPVFWSGRASQILFLGFSKDIPGDIRDKFTYGGLAKPSSDTVVTCMFLQLQGVSVLLSCSSQLLRASYNW